MYWFLPQPQKNVQYLEPLKTCRGNQVTRCHQNWTSEERVYILKENWWHLQTLLLETHNIMASENSAYDRVISSSSTSQHTYSSWQLLLDPHLLFHASSPESLLSRFRHLSGRSIICWVQIPRLSSNQDILL